MIGRKEGDEGRKEGRKERKRFGEARALSDGRLKRRKEMKEGNGGRKWRKNYEGRK